MTLPDCVAVTGASGFLGSHLLRALRDLDVHVVAVSRQPPSITGVTYRPSAYDKQSLETALRGAAVVVHLAARRTLREDDRWSLDPYLTPNVTLMEKLADAGAAAGAEQMVLASTRTVYPLDAPKPFIEGRDEAPQSAYGLSKLFAEQYLSRLARAHGLACVSLRFAILYGEGERLTPVLMRFTDIASGANEITLTGNAEQRLDQLYVKDAVTAIIAALTRPQVEGPINIGSGRAISVRQIAETVNRVYENSAGIVDRSDPLGPPTGVPLDITRASRELGWSPRFDLAEGLLAMRSANEG